MTQITAALVKELREKTGVGMMDCKKALSETSGDLEAAVDWLRKQGLAAAAKKAGRIASEGLIGLSVGDNLAALVEINSETDFVSRNQDFQNIVNSIGQIALGCKGDIEALEVSQYPGTDRNVKDEITALVATIGENINLRRTSVLSVDKGLIGSYMHAATAPNLGRIGALVALESAVEPSKLEKLGHELAMHIAAAKPQAVTIEEINAEDLEREKAILREQAEGSGKPAEIIDKMVEGRLRKYYEEVVLLNQTFILDSESRVSDVIAKVSEELGSPVTIIGMKRFELGEGIEREASDFAAEVAAQLN